MLQPPFRFSSSLHVSPNKGIKIKIKTQPKKQKISKTGGATHVDLWHDVSQTFSCLHEIHPNDLCILMSNHQTSSNLPRNSSKNTSSKFRPPYAWRSKKCKSLRLLPQRSRGVPQRVPHGGTLDTEAAAVVAAEDVHSIGHVAPYRCVAPACCGRRFARGLLTPAIGLAKVAHMF